MSIKTDQARGMMISASSLDSEAATLELRANALRKSATAIRNDASKTCDHDGTVEHGYAYSYCTVCGFSDL